MLNLLILRVGWYIFLFFFFQAEDGIRDWSVTGVQTCALPISRLVRIVIENAVEFAGDKFRFGLGVPRFEIFQVSPGTLLRAQRLAQPLRIVGNDRAGGVQNVLSGAVIALQLNDSGGGKIAGRAQEDGNVGAAPAADGWILIADDTNVLLWSG